MALLEDENLRRAKVAAGHAFAEQTDWAFEIKKIEAALYEALNVRSAAAAL